MSRHFGLFSESLKPSSSAPLLRTQNELRELQQQDDDEDRIVNAHPHPAFLRETQRRQDSEKLFHDGHNAEIIAKINGKVHSGYVDEELVLSKDSTVQNREILFDVLPSFEMYHSVHFSNPNESFNPDVRELPPNYAGDGGNDYIQGRGNIGTEITGSSSSLPSSNNSIVVDPETNSTNNSDNIKSIIDNIHKLPWWQNSLINFEIEIVITKDVPVPNEKYQQESPLKEYTNGDIVHGFFKLKNISNKPIEFRMFYVTLEGLTTLIDPITKKRTLKKFLNMMDISSSWSYADISSSANLKFQAESFDFEGCYLGLPNDRILKPQVNYKKFFTFKFPYHTLDNNCRHQLTKHNYLPPSFGIDRLKNGLEFSNVKINSLLGYGHNGRKGCPILTKDLSTDLISINYTINTTLVGFHPRSKNSLYLLADKDFSLRFIPFEFNDEHNRKINLNSSLNDLKSLGLQIDTTLSNIERHLESISKDPSEIEKIDHEIKLSQLNNNLKVSSLNDSSDDLLLKRGDGIDDNSFKFENGLVYLLDDKKMTKNNNASSHGLLSKLRSKSEKSNGKKPIDNEKLGNGFIKIITYLPKEEGLPYISPPSLRKINNENDNDLKTTFNFKIEMSFLPSDLNNNIEPPMIKSIESKLVILNISSIHSIPINLTVDLFNVDDLKRIQTQFSKYELKLTQLIDMINSNKELDIRDYISNQLMHDIKSINELTYKETKLQIFEPISTDSFKWINNQGEWLNKFKVQLKLKEKIQETLIPDFQTCLLSRLYYVEVQIKFKGGQSSLIKLPVSIRRS